MTDKQELATIPAGPRGLQLNDLDSMWRFAQAVAKATDLRPKALDTPEKVLVAMQYGCELGMAPMQAINSVAVINGRPSVYGEALIAVANNSGLIKDVHERIEGKGDDMTAYCQIVRHDGRKTTGDFSVANARKAGLWGKSGPWSSYPERMLMWRARGFAYRDSVPEALRGLWFREEVEDIPMRDVTPQAKQPPQEVDPLLAIAPSAHELKKELDEVEAEFPIKDDETEPPGASPPLTPASPEDDGAAPGAAPPGGINAEYIITAAEHAADLGYVELEKYGFALSDEGKDVVRKEWKRLKVRAEMADLRSAG